MKTIIKSNIFLLLISIAGCAGNINNNGEMNLKINYQNIDAWINLMPGVSAGHRIHIAGKILIKNLSDESVDKLMLREIRIVQNNYALSMKTISFASNDTTGILHNEEKIFSFNASDKTTGSKINFDSAASLIFFFSSDGRTFTDSLNDVVIKKVY